jgi:hypothetical protein
MKGAIDHVRSARQRGVPIFGLPNDGAAIPVWGHWSNDNYAPGEEMMNKRASGHPLFAGRGWFYFGLRAVNLMTAHVQWQVGKRATLCLASLSVDPVKGGVGLSLALPRVFYLFLGLDGWPKKFYEQLGIYKSYEPHAIEISVHDQSIWWRLWSPTMRWSNTTPRWREGNASPAEMLFGDIKMTEEIIYTKNIEVPMPEKAYPAKLTMFRRVWRRPRASWVSHEGTFANVEVEGGVPIPGKGTTSYNCGPDAIYEHGTPARNDEEAIASFVQSALQRRARYGSGHRDAPTN